MNKVNVWRIFALSAGMLSASLLHAASCDYELRREWNSGFTAAITITNNTNAPIEGWTVSVPFTDGSTIANNWNSNVSDGNPYQFDNVDYNANIAVNASVEFGFNGAKPSVDSALITPILGGICTPGETENRAPTAAPTASTLTGFVPFDVTFDGSTSSDPDGDPLSYNWQIDGADVSSNASFSSTFEQPGNYSVTLTVNDGTLNSAPVTFTVVASDEGTAAPLYILDGSKSSLYFVSTKKTHTMETHEFTSLAGVIASDGNASLTINLADIESGIDIRNERMRSLLFEVDNFPRSTVSMSVDVAELAGMPLGSAQIQDASANLNLHGVELTVSTQLSVTKLSANSILVQNVSPLVIDANDFGLNVGIDALRDVANLSVISYTVPVNFTLFFNTP